MKLIPVKGVTCIIPGIKPLYKPDTPSARIIVLVACNILVYPRRLSCAISRVLITSNGVVTNVPKAPARPPKVQYR